jgi:glycosyltransferase involved in cell wall biosynthesis
LEVIVVNDGSRDSTAQVLEELALERRDKRLRIIHRENAGLSEARNIGIRQARGQYIGFLDADDAWCSQKAERQIAVLDADPTVGLTFSYAEFMAEDGTLTGRYTMCEKAEVTLTDLLQRNHIGNGSTPILRRECLDVAGIFRSELRACEDYELWCRILAKTGLRAVLVPQVLTLIRERSNSLSRSEAFLPNADRAMAILRTTMPEVASKVFRVGHAEHYRIAALNALKIGRRRVAVKYMVMAVHHYPWLLFTTWRAVGTVVFIIIPRRLRILMTEIYQAFRHREFLERAKCGQRRLRDHGAADQ